MYHGHFNGLRPLTKRMLDFLLECHERELMNMQPLEATHGSVKGLSLRKLVDTRYSTDPNGKKFMSVHITEAGKLFLDSHFLSLLLCCMLLII